METEHMGVIRPKAKPDQTTEARLSEARAELARIEAAIVGADREIDLQLLDGDHDAIRQAEAAAGSKRTGSAPLADVYLRSFSPSGYARACTFQPRDPAHASIHPK